MQTLRGNESGCRVRDGDVVKQPKLTSITRRECELGGEEEVKRERMESWQRTTGQKTENRACPRKTLKTETFDCGGEKGKEPLRVRSK